MARLSVNPTRMELTRLKGKLRTARRGHKLLKDKRDELMKQFLDRVRQVRALREEAERELTAAYRTFAVASGLMGREAVEQALLCPIQRVTVEETSRNILSVTVPEYTLKVTQEDWYPYGFAETSAELDLAMEALASVFRKLVRLAEEEQAVLLMAEEIEKTRRRVNALEYVVIPDTQETIRYITMKLDEQERSTTTRLMKVKEMLLEEALEERRAASEKRVEAFSEIYHPI